YREVRARNERCRATARQLAAGCGALCPLALDSVGMPLVVLAELLFGVEKSARREQNPARLDRFAAGVRVLAFAAALVARYESQAPLPTALSLGGAHC
ncbi:MAG: hypothetical protein ABJB12_21125, partial [Pseudomonadota bacterium]